MSSASRLKSSGERSDKSELKRIRKEIDLFKLLILYLKTDPNEEYIVKQRDDLAVKIRNANKAILSTLGKIDNVHLKRAARKQLKKDYRIQDMNARLTALTYLIS